MIKRLFKFLSKPHLIPNKIYNKLINYIYVKNYKSSFFEKKQNDLFFGLGLNRKKGISRLIEIKNKLNINKYRPMESEHETLFSSLSISSDIKIQKILEIGTFDGYNSFLLSNLFQNSIIKTIDLKSSSKLFNETYNRNYENDVFVKNRNNFLKKNDNLIFEELNSLNLINLNEKFDLIWIDGAHGYPTVCIDIINSLNLINKSGYLVCDDVHKYSPSKEDKIYSSIASYETLKALESENIIKLKFIYKRLDPLNNSNPKKRKFLAVFSKL